MSKVLNMSLKRIWYRAIDRGTKTIEYRDMTEYWIGKLLDKSMYGNLSVEEIRKGLSKGDLELYPSDWTNVRFHCQSDVMEFEINDIRVYDGHTTFAIYLGKRVK